MQVILLEKLHMGALGDKVNVRDGYARNFLLPKGKAVRATQENIAKFEAMRVELEKQQAEQLAAAHQRAEAIKSLEIVISSNAGEEGKLFGSIGNRDIAEAITLLGQVVEKREVLLPNGSLRSVGEHLVQLQLHADVLIEVRVLIQADA